MCTVCGCAGAEAALEGRSSPLAGAARHNGHDHHHHHHGDYDHHDHGGDHDHDHGHRHHHHHGDDHAHHHHGRHDHGDGQSPHSHLHGVRDHAAGHGHSHDDGDRREGLRAGPADGLHFGLGAAGAHVPGLGQTRLVEIETAVLAKNDAFAAANRRRFADAASLALNLVSSPGSGKTTLLVRTIEALAGRFPATVIEGDQQTSHDADRIRATGAPAVQINTGKGCHLDAEMVGRALDRLAPPAQGVVFIENVGNLVCPAGFDLGEAAKVVIFSATEGEDKPLKYPDMFAAAGLVVLSKIDLAPHCDADLALAEANCRRVNPSVAVLRLSARTGEGMGAWIDWIASRRRAAIARAVDEARARLAALEAAS